MLLSVSPYVRERLSACIFKSKAVLRALLDVTCKRSLEMFIVDLRMLNHMRHNLCRFVDCCRFHQAIPDEHVLKYGNLKSVRMIKAHFFLEKTKYVVMRASKRTYTVIMTI